MNRTHGITPENLLRTLPSVLADDEGMLSLARVVADALGAVATRPKQVSLYANIDSMSEGLLDILARDFKVDWYDFNYSLETKRALIRDCVKVHRHIGTAGAVVMALGDIYPGTKVLEWFEYGGQPHHFMVTLDLTDQREPVLISQLYNTLGIFKSLRSVLEDYALMFRSRADIVLSLASGYAVYATRLCGTFPAPAMQGDIVRGEFLVSAEGRDVLYAVPITGAGYAGTVPDAATQGGIVQGEFQLSGKGQETVYAVPESGSSNTGTIPDAATQGGVEDRGIKVGAGGECLAYSAPVCGTSPDSL